jgi:hypothetical protein
MATDTSILFLWPTLKFEVNGKEKVWNEDTSIMKNKN